MSRIEVYSETKLDYGVCPEGDPRPGEMRVFYENDKPVFVEFLCPCGCGAACPMRVVAQGGKRVHDRVWEFSPGPTLDPSVRWVGGCRAHFNITAGRVVWHGDSGR